MTANRFDKFSFLIALLWRICGNVTKPNVSHTVFISDGKCSIVYCNDMNDFTCLYVVQRFTHRTVPSLHLLDAQPTEGRQTIALLAEHDLTVPDQFFEVFQLLRHWL
jgi:hypothetical protein